MRLKQEPPAPKFTLYQIGDALIPRVDFETQLSYRARDVVDQLHGADGDFDYFRCARSPLERGELKHTGKYLDECLTRADCGPALHEWTKLRRTTGTYQPFIFYMTDPEPYCAASTPAACGCPVIPKCGKWLWAWGKVLNVVNYASIDDWMTPAVTDIEIEARIESPMREIHPLYWRWGKAPVKPIEPCATLASAEQLIAREAACYFAPCDIPADCCGVDRWWRREAIECWYCGDCRFNSSLWPICDIYKFRSSTVNAGCFVIDVQGSYRPETRWIIQPDTYITIENFLGSKTYHFPACDNLIYIDTATGEVKTISGSNTVDLGYACDIPGLEAGENRIIFTSNFELGVVPTWIN